MKKLEVFEVIKCEETCYTCRSSNSSVLEIHKNAVAKALSIGDKIIVRHENGEYSVYTTLHKDSIEFWKIIKIEGDFVTLQNSQKQYQEILKADFVATPIIGNLGVMRKYKDGSYAPIGETSASFYTDEVEIKKIKAMLN